MKYYCHFYLLGTHVAALDKVVYLHNRRFLPASHSLRKAKKNFPSGKTEHRSAPEKLTQEEVMVNSLAYENAKNATQAAGFATATQECPTNYFSEMVYFFSEQQTDVF